MVITGKYRKEEGSIIIVALLICAMGAIGVTAWLAVITARNGQVEQIESAVARRIRAENGRAAAKEYFYRNVVTQSTGLAYSESLPGGWGGFSMSAWGGAGEPPMGSLVQGVVNQFSPSPYFTYTKDFTVAVNDGVSNLNHTLRVRSRSPLTGGDLFSLHRPTLSPGVTNSISGNINVFGRSVMWEGEPAANVDDLDSTRYVSPDVASASLLLDDPGGGVSMPDNYPLSPTTNSEIAGSATYDGELNLVDGGLANAENSMIVKMGAPMVVNGSVYLAETNGVSCNGNGRVYIDLDEPTLGAVVVQNVFRVYLYGQQTPAEVAAAAALNPVTIVLVRSNLAERDLFSLRMFDQNARPLNVGIKKLVGGAEVWGYIYDSNINPLWRMMLTMENAPLRLINIFGGTVTMQGGIRTDRSIRHTGWYTVPGAYNIAQETQPGNLETLDVRTAWVESFWQ